MAAVDEGCVRKALSMSRNIRIKVMDGTSMRDAAAAAASALNTAGVLESAAEHPVIGKVSVGGKAFSVAVNVSRSGSVIGMLIAQR